MGELFPSELGGAIITEVSEMFLNYFFWWGSVIFSEFREFLEELFVNNESI